MKTRSTFSLLALLLAPVWVASATTGQIFTTTAYYSPTPYQSYYLYGSYEAEKRVQGEGIAWASGEKVALGMLAAPSTYAFGTKISLEGLGVGSVLDRWGAIVSATASGGNDRIDIWMGVGEEGLKKAIAWGRRDVIGTIVDAEEVVTLDISSIDTDSIRLPAQVQNQTRTQVQTQKKTAPMTKFQSELFEKLTTLGYTGATLTEKIIQYQLKNGIISSRADAWAGIYGPRTRASLEEIAGGKSTASTENTEENTVSPEEYSPVLESIVGNTQYRDVLAEVESFGTPELGEVWVHVRKLQIFLRDRNYLAVKDTAYFWPLTEEALQKYQGAHTLFPSGKIDIATKDAMILDLLNASES